MSIWTESKADNGGEPCADFRYLACWCHPDFGTALNNRKRVKGSDIKIAVVEGERRRPDPVDRCGKTYGEVDDTRGHTAVVILSSS